MINLIGIFTKLIFWAIGGYLVYFFANQFFKKAIAKFLEKTYQGQEREKRETTLSILASNFLKIAIIVIVLLTVLPEFGVNIAPLLASAGVIGLAISFASRSLIEDYISGIFILIDNQIQIGDEVFIGPPIGIEGEVIDFNFRQITIKDKEGAVAVIRNSKIPFIVKKQKKPT